MPFPWRRPLQAAGILLIFAPAIVLVLRRPPVQETMGVMAPSDPTPEPPSPADSSRRSGPADDRTLPIRREALDARARDEGQEALRRMKLQWRLEREAELKAQAEGRLGCGFKPPGRFVRMSRAHQPEIDLFSRGYPPLAEAWAGAAAKSKETPDWERAAALTCLGSLWQAGWTSAASSLVRLSRDRSPDEWDYALHLLAAGDRSGLYRPLYRESAEAGQTTALEALSYWNDAEAVKIVTDAMSRWRDLPAPRGSNHLIAEEVLPRLNAFASGTWETLAKTAILEEPGPLMRGHIAWALRIAAEHRPVWLEAVLRQRLARAYNAAAVHFSPDTHPRTEDDAYDDVLLTLARIGGTLTDQEKAYLVHFGYCCEPRERLGGVLRERNYAR